MIAALCQTRHYGFKSRQSLFELSAGISARSEWCTNQNPMRF
jgi:hypothetical protein